MTCVFNKMALPEGFANTLFIANKNLKEKKGHAKSNGVPSTFWEGDVIEYAVILKQPGGSLKNSPLVFRVCECKLHYGKQC